MTRKKYLLINADGYGFTKGITQAIEECVAFGTLRSLSVNVNFKEAERIVELVKKYPFLSVGSHLNPVVGKPVLPQNQVKTLLNEDGEFLYKKFVQNWRAGKINPAEMRAELLAQIEMLRGLVGGNLSHIDFHMGLQRIPGLYSLYLDVVESSGVKRLRTDHYFFGVNNKYPHLTHLGYLLINPVQLAKYIYNYRQKRLALARGLITHDRKVTMINSHRKADSISVDNFINILKNLPGGYNELVVHPAYIDDDLKKYSTLLEPRTRMLKVLTDIRFKQAISDNNVELVGYKDIPLNNKN